jgi:hypothetical protein
LSKKTFTPFSHRKFTKSLETASIMVFIQPPLRSPQVLTAFLAAPLSEQELGRVKSAFEFGATSEMRPSVEMRIVKVPEYIGKPHAYIRAKETEAGREKYGFVVIDEAAVKRNGIWFVKHFAEDWNVEHGQALSTSALWKILVRPDCLPLTWVNYDIANMDIQENLLNSGVEFPIGDDFHQPEVYRCGGLDMEAQRARVYTLVVAEPGEFEESSDEQHTGNIMPRPSSVARFKPGIAESIGLVNAWSIPQPGTEIKMPDGSKKMFPEGSIRLSLRYDPSFERPPYQWPEGSL